MFTVDSLISILDYADIEWLSTAYKYARVSSTFRDIILRRLKRLVKQPEYKNMFKKLALKKGGSEIVHIFDLQKEDVLKNGILKIQTYSWDDITASLVKHRKFRFRYDYYNTFRVKNFLYLSERFDLNEKNIKDIHLLYPSVIPSRYKNTVLKRLIEQGESVLSTIVRYNLISREDMDVGALIFYASKSGNAKALRQIYFLFHPPVDVLYYEKCRSLRYAVRRQSSTMIKLLYELFNFPKEMLYVSNDFYRPNTIQMAKKYSSKETVEWLNSTFKL